MQLCSALNVTRVTACLIPSRVDRLLWDTSSSLRDGRPRSGGTLSNWLLLRFTSDRLCSPRRPSIEEIWLNDRSNLRRREQFVRFSTNRMLLWSNRSSCSLWRDRKQIGIQEIAFCCKQSTF